MTMVLGVDAGGTSTRAVVMSLDGKLVGRGLAGCGNPMAAGTATAFGNMRQAVESALSSTDPASIKGGVVGFAGSGILREPSASAAFADVFAGLPAPPIPVGDVVVTFAAGTPAADGTVLVSGTGAIAAKIIDRCQDRVADGFGWLLGDEGSGFWLGRAAARVAVRELTAGTAGPLTLLVLDALAPQAERAEGPHPTGERAGTPPDLTVAWADPRPDLTVGWAGGSGPAAGKAEGAGRPGSGGRAGLGGELVDMIAATVQSRPPLALAELAPLVSLAAAEGDPAALSIVEAAATRLARTAAEVREPGDGSPIVLAGSVLTSAGPVRRAVRALLEQRWAAAPVTVAADGAGAAAWLAALDLLGTARAAPLHSRFVGYSVSGGLGPS
ncbi:N-acetylglucosamine kinase [Nonomuraea sp. bgisy101]|uniref:N-acetylglucosamine kinase n=1 Tax=Nonomuraea sp. bgisy101 TaxID=3413784 RepID=UPI003D75DA4B